MKKAFLIASMAIALSGCQYIPGTPQHSIETAKAAVAAQLKDPASAQFTEVSASSDTVCGYVNGRNSFGGYVGAQRFVRSTVTGQTLIEGGARPTERYAAASYDVDQCQVDRVYAACKAGKPGFAGTMHGVNCAAELAGVRLG